MIIRHIISNELTRLLRDRVILALAVLIVALLTVSVYSGQRYYKQLQQAQSQAEQISRQQWEQQGDKNPHSAAHYGTFAFKPVNVLMVFEPGITRYTGVFLFLEGHRQNIASFSLAEDLDASVRFAELTPAFIFTYLFPLFIIFAGFRMIVSEKESGMYRFLMAQGVSRIHLITGKAAALWILVVLLFIPFFLTGLLVAGLTSESNTDLLRYSSLSFIWLMYFGIIIHLTIGISSVSRQAASAMVTLLAIWMIATLLVPRIATNMASQRHPVPTTNAFYTTIRTDLTEGVDGHNPLSQHSVAFRDSVLMAHGVTDVADLPFNFRGMMLQEAEEFEKRVYDLHFARIAAIHDKQLDTFSAAALLSPAIAMRLSAMHVAGTDVQAFQHFTQEAENYRIKLMRELNHDLRDNAIGHRAVGYVTGHDFFSRNPVFVYQRPTQVLSTGAILPFFLSLFAWFIASAGFVMFVASKEEIV
jgi:ABC-2 type transport system permease protein